ncbi:MAG TPA: NADP-dependent phosphogluconate dehydrogenase [Blastocatellia bacterium]|nr:NADP-dependent phosphogluconate dehydrogenase [Blastocatellia bacterium]
MSDQQSNRLVVPAVTSARVGVIGLGAMGSNLALNFERNGFGVAVWERMPEMLDRFVASQPAGSQIIGSHEIAEFVHSLERPRVIVILVKAGQPVDWTIGELKPHLERGDILLDGGNSHFKDTMRRQQELDPDGIRLIGCGVSGGSEGALRGPSLMPGGSREAYSHVSQMLEAVAAKVDDGPCVTYIGPGGAGHFVKMVHNGIEYGVMQLIAEAYDVMRKVLGMQAHEIADVFDRWNDGKLNSFLVEITAKVLRVKDEETGRPLVDLVLDKAGQKGTGRWTSELALELGVPIPTIDAALSARFLSALKEERLVAAREYPGLGNWVAAPVRDEVILLLESALYASAISSFAQGFALISAGSREFGWQIELPELARIWQGGCIIRARLLKRIKTAYSRAPELPNLLLDGEFAADLAAHEQDLRKAIQTALQFVVPVPAFCASLGYSDSYRSAELPQNLTQAQRDYFGAHTYERRDKPGAAPFHSEWKTDDASS